MYVDPDLKGSTCVDVTEKIDSKIAAQGEWFRTLTEAYSVPTQFNKLTQFKSLISPAM